MAGHWLSCKVPAEGTNPSLAIRHLLDLRRQHLNRHGGLVVKKAVERNCQLTSFRVRAQEAIAEAFAVALVNERRATITLVTQAAKFTLKVRIVI